MEDRGINELTHGDKILAKLSMIAAFGDPEENLRECTGITGEAAKHLLEKELEKLIAN